MRYISQCGKLTIYVQKLKILRKIFLTLQFFFFVKLKSEIVFGVKIQRQFTILNDNWQFLGKKKKVEVHQKVDFLSKRIERKEVKQSQKFTIHWGNVIQLIFQWQQKRTKKTCLWFVLSDRKSVKNPSIIKGCVWDYSPCLVDFVQWIFSSS